MPHPDRAVVVTAKARICIPLAHSKVIKYTVIFFLKLQHFSDGLPNDACFRISEAS